jgi:hypothetical protein
MSSKPFFVVLCLTVVTVPTSVLNQIPSTSSSAFELGEVGRIDTEEGVELRGMANGLRPIRVVARGDDGQLRVTTIAAARSTRQ